MDGLVMSRGMNVTFGRFSRFVVLDRVRAVAKTCKPRDWNSSASAYPIPPALQPVIRTDLGAINYHVVLRVRQAIR